MTGTWRRVDMVGTTSDGWYSIARIGVGMPSLDEADQWTIHARAGSCPDPDPLDTATLDEFESSTLARTCLLACYGLAGLPRPRVVLESRAWVSVEHGWIVARMGRGSAWQASADGGSWIGRPFRTRGAAIAALEDAR